MPYGNGTGSNGMGPMTGRGAGFCAGYNTPGYMNPMGGGRGLARGFGRGLGYGMGRGRAWGRPGIGRTGFGGYPAPPTATPGYEYQGYPAPYGGAYNKEDEITFLKNQAEYLEDQLKSVKDRLDDLESEEE